MLNGLERQVFEYIELNRDPMLEFLQKMVRIDTQTPPGLNYGTLCELLADRYHALGYETGLHEATEKYMRLSGASHMGLKGPRSNMVARLKGAGTGPTLHISAHSDTAAIQEEGWTRARVQTSFSFNQWVRLFLVSLLFMSRYSIVGQKKSFYPLF